MIYYPTPLHLQALFSVSSLHTGVFPESERAAQEVLSLPMYPELTDDQAAYVIRSIREFVAAQGK